MQKIHGLANRHVACREARDGFKNVAAVDAGFFARTIRQNRNHNDVAESLAQGESGIAAHIGCLFLLVVRVLPRGEVARLCVKRFQQAVERAGGHQMKIGLVDVVLLNFLQHFAVHRE
jgi:hypothetical protein